MEATFKAKAPLSPLFFDPTLFAHPNVQTNNSEHNPEGLQHVHGIEKWWHHGLMAPLLYPWREREKLLGGSGSSWLLCVLCCV
jgi:hypothetical protein